MSEERTDHTISQHRLIVHDKIKWLSSMMDPGQLCKVLSTSYQLQINSHIFIEFFAFTQHTVEIYFWRPHIQCSWVEVG